jgi:hypothetical protein
VCGSYSEILDMILHFLRLVHFPDEEKATDNFTDGMVLRGAKDDSRMGPPRCGHAEKIGILGYNDSALATANANCSSSADCRRLVSGHVLTSTPWSRCPVAMRGSTFSSR